MKSTPLEDAIAAKAPALSITIERDTLHAALTRICGALDRKGQTAFSHVLLDAKDGELTLRAMSSDMQATATVRCDVKSPGATTAPGDQLRAITSALAPGAQVSIEQGERLLVKCGRSKWKLPTVPADLLAPWPASVDTTTFTFSARVLASALSRTLFAAAKDAAKGANLQGVYADPKPDGMRFVATNSHRLALVQTNVAGEGRATILAPQFVAEAIRVLDGNGDCTLTMGPSRSEIQYGALTIVSKVIDGQYVPYERVIPTHTDTITLSRDALASAMKRVLAVATSSRSVRLMADGDTLALSSRAADSGEASDELECVREGDAFTIAVNSGYLAEALAVMEEPQVALLTGKPMQPVVMVEGDLTQLVVPQALGVEG